MAIPGDATGVSNVQSALVFAAAAVVAAAKPDQGEPRQALERLRVTTWHKLDHLHSLIVRPNRRVKS
jgi:hypothetical protein